MKGIEIICTFVMSLMKAAQIAEKMSLTSVTRSELKALNISDFKQGDLIDVINKDGEAIYTIHVSYGNGKYSRASLCTTVTDKNYNLLGCTPGTPNGWPYYISDFIRSINEK